MTGDANDARPRVFIGCSTEQLPVAQDLQVLLDRSCEVEIWTQGMFAPGRSTLDSLVAGVGRFDFAVLVVSADDTTLSRGTLASTTRDNVIFELGLFMGALGPERTLMVENRMAPLALPSDLDGLTRIDYAPFKDGNLSAALGAAATKLRRVFQALGPLTASMRKAAIAQEAEQDEAASDITSSPSVGSLGQHADENYVDELVHRWMDSRPDERTTIALVIQGLQELGFKLTPSIPRSAGGRSRSYLRALRKGDGKNAGYLESSGFSFVGTAAMVSPGEVWAGRYPYILWSDEGAAALVLRAAKEYTAR